MRIFIKKIYEDAKVCFPLPLTIKGYSGSLTRLF